MIAILGPEYLEGFRRLLEKDGDITMVAQYPSLTKATRGADRYPHGVFVIGPGAEVTSAGWDGAPLSRSIVVTPTPSDGRFPRGVIEIPMELTGNRLRAAIRKCERVPTPPLHLVGSGHRALFDRPGDFSEVMSHVLEQSPTADARDNVVTDRLMHDPAADLTAPREKEIPT